MKKWIIGSLVGAIIVFAWQAASWMFLGIHNDAVKHTPAEENILSALTSNLTEEGSYMIPCPKPDATQKEKDEWMKQQEGKPWATVIYHPSHNSDMTNAMIWGFVVDLILVILLISILVRGGLPTFTGIFTGCIAVGIFSFLWHPYMGHVWFQLPWSMIKGDLYDAVAAWGLCGLWLGWWLRRP